MRVNFSPRLACNAYLGGTSDYENNLNEVAADGVRNVMKGLAKTALRLGMLDGR